MKKIFLICFILIFSLSFISAAKIIQTNVGDVGLQIFFPDYEYIKINTPFNLHIHASNLSDGKELNNTLANCSLHLYDKTGNHILETEMFKDSNDIDWELYIAGGNFSALGEHAFRIFCLDTVGGTVGGTFNVNYLGIAPPTGFDGRFILLLFFMSLIVLLVFFQNKINFDQWYKSILNKYTNRNFFRTFVAGIGYFFMSNPFSLFYMIGLVIVLLLFDITRVYVLEAAHGVMQSIVVIYLFGLLFLLIEVLGDLHEFFSKMSDNIKGMGWGIDND